MKQARTAASRLAAGGSGAPCDCPAVDQLLRCAKLSEDAAHTLDWALESLRVHGRDHTDQLAYQIVQAARSRLDTPVAAVAAAAVPASSSSLAWV